jgi:uncharacterized membrane protein YgdD (TMEM256/DUF423 family)
MLTALAGLSGFIAVAMGAVAAHTIHEAHGADMVREAALYQLIHTIALLCAAPPAGKLTRAAALLFIAGIALFSGGLYLRYAAGLALPAGVIPAGGICFMAGWLMLAVSALAKGR